MTGGVQGVAWHERRCKCLDCALQRLATEEAEQIARIVKEHLSKPVPAQQARP